MDIFHLENRLNLLKKVFSESMSYVQELKTCCNWAAFRICAWWWYATAWKVPDQEMCLILRKKYTCQIHSLPFFLSSLQPISSLGFIKTQFFYILSCFSFNNIWNDVHVKVACSACSQPPTLICYFMRKML